MDWRRRLIQKWRVDPSWWIENVLGDRLWKKQREICASIVDHERTAVPACFDDQTEVLTKGITGVIAWKLFKDLKSSDKISCLIDGFMGFEYPIRHYEADYDGELIGVKNYGIDFLVTPNHRLYCRPLYDGSYTIRSAESAYNNYFHFRIIGNPASPDIYVSSSHWYKQKYQGKVYCVETTSGIIAVRRNGKQHWSGNSFYLGN